MRQKQFNNSSGARLPRFSLFSNIIASVCILIYIGAIVFAGIWVYNSIRDRRTLAGREFSDLARRSSDLWTLEGVNDVFKAEITNEILKSKCLQGIIISGPWGDYTMERNLGEIIAWNESTPVFKFPFGVSKEPLSTPIVLGEYRSTIKAVYNYIDYEILIAIFKRTLFVVLATLALALFTLIFQRFAFTIPRPKRESSILEEDIPLERSERNEDSKKPAMIDMETLSKIYKSRPRGGGEGKVKRDLPFVQKEVFSTEKKDKDKDKEKEENIVEKKEIDILTPAIKNPSKPLPSSEENKIGKESNMQDKLEAELKRSSSLDQDLVFMIVEIQEGKTFTKGLRLLEDESVKLFLRRDLVFEKGPKGVSIIIPNIDLDQGFTKSEKLYNRVIDKYKETFASEAKIYMGLSSRALRKIDAQSIIFEANGALKKAYEYPDSPIVAFKSDPEKYKAFIDAQKKAQS